MIRIFVGIQFPAPTITYLETAACGLKGARWIEPENLHLTVRFIGEVDGGVMGELAEALEEIRFPPFTLQIRGLDFFRRGKQIHTLFAGIDPSRELVGLKSQIDRCLSEFEIRSDPKRFTPHVTLARVQRAHPEKVQQFIGDHLQFEAPPAEIDRFHLFSSVLTEKGANYTIEQTYPLASSEREHIQKLIALEQENGGTNF